MLFLKTADVSRIALRYHQDQSGVAVAGTLPSVGSSRRKRTVWPWPRGALSFCIYSTLQSPVLPNKDKHYVERYAWFHSVFQADCASGCHAEVTPLFLFMSVPGEGTHFYRRLNPGSAAAKTPLSSSRRVGRQLRGHPEATHAWGHGSRRSPHPGPSPSRSSPHTESVRLLRCLRTHCIEAQASDSGVRETVIYTNVVNTSSV